MKLLLDTHVLIWVLTESNRLSAPVVQNYTNPANQAYVSAASFWEMAIKISLGKLTFHPTNWTMAIKTELEYNGIRWLPIEPDHCALVATLPFHHRDPFDRLLVAQALYEEMVLASADTVLAAYGATILW